jgi:hypothetical protein
LHLLYGRAFDPSRISEDLWTPARSSRVKKFKHVEVFGAYNMHD